MKPENSDLKDGIIVVLLAYQEAENLNLLLPDIHKHISRVGVPYEIIVIDSRKPLDNTSTICAKWNARYINQEEDGFGGALRTGIKYADHKSFLILDSDGSHNPEYIPDLCQKRLIEGYDLVIGSRYTKGGKTNDSKISIAMSRILNTCFRICIGVKALDISTDYRIYDTAQLKRVSLTCRNYDILQEVILKMKLNNPSLRIAEIPIVFEKRVFGSSKRKLLPFIISYIKTLFTLAKIRFAHKGLK